MDDIDSYYTERPAYPRPPPPHMRMGPPPYGRPQMGGPMGPPRMPPQRSASPGPRMGPGPGPGRSASPGQRMGPGPMGGQRPMGPGMGGPRQMGRPMGPGSMDMRGRIPGPPGPPPMGALPRRPESPFRGPPPMGALARRPESPRREPGLPGPPPMGALPRRPESPLRDPPPMGALARRPESPRREPGLPGPPPMGALAGRPESPFGEPRRDMVPAPLNLRRPSPPPQPVDAPQRRQSPPVPPMTPGRMRPLDNIGAPRMRAPSPNPNTMHKPLNSIGAPRPPRSSSARPADDRPSLLQPQLDGHVRTRSASADDYRKPEEVVSPVTPHYMETLASMTYAPVSSKEPMPNFLPSTTFRTASPQPISQAPPVRPPGSVSPHQPSPDDIVLSLAEFEDITVGPYQDIDVPPPLPRKNSLKPSVASQVLCPRVPSPPTMMRQDLPPAPEDESPLPHARGLRSMWLGDIQAGPYAGDAPPMPGMPPSMPPSRSLSRSPPALDSSDMSEPPSDSEDNFVSHSLPPLFAGLRIQTGAEEPTLAPATYKPHESPLSTSAYTPGTPDENNRDSYATDIIDVQIDESSPIDDEDSHRKPRKHIPSMCEYMSMDQLEALWGKEDQFGSGFGSGYFSFDPAPTAFEDEHRPSGTPF